MKKSDNRGMSLVEIIIVIAIMGVLVGLFFTSTNYIGVSQARGLANSIKTAVGQARVQTMGKYETYLYIYKSSDDGLYYKEFWKKYDVEHGLVRDKREVIGKNRPQVKYFVKGDTSTEHLIGSGKGLLIKFDRSSGKEQKDIVMPSGSVDGDGNPLDPDKTVECNKIVVSYGSREYVITIVPETGKISL